MPFFLYFFLLCFLINTSDIESKNKIKRSRLTKLAEKEYAKARYDKALKLFQKSIEKGDETGAPPFFIGLILETRREYRESIPYYIEAVSRPLKKQYKKAALWKIVLYFRQTGSYAQLLEYSEVLQNLVGPNKRLEEIIENAELNATPVHREARRIFKEVNDLEAGFLPDKKQPSFWQDHAYQIENAARLYEYLSGLHERYQNFAWKAANYYENLEIFNDAVRVYRWIASIANSQKANYKIGVLLKKQKKYTDAEGYLVNVIHSDEANKILKYYAYISLAQSHYGAHNFTKAKEGAENALARSFKKIQKPHQRNILYLLKCNTSLQIPEITKSSEDKKVLHDLSRMFKPCYSFITKKKFFHKSKDHNMITLSNLVRGKWFHLLSLTSENKSKEYSELAFQYYITSFADNEVIEEPIKEEEQEILDDERSGIIIYEEPIRPKKKRFKRSDWCLGELNTMVSLLFTSQKHEALKQFLLEYEEKLKGDPNYPIWLADSFFYTEDYAQAYQAYQKLPNRSFEFEKKLLLSYAHLQKWEDLKSEFKKYIYTSMESKEKMVSFLNSQAEFLKLREEKGFSDFLEEVDKIEVPNIEPAVNPAPPEQAAEHESSISPSGEN